VLFWSHKRKEGTEDKVQRDFWQKDIASVEGGSLG
jgi:hypothetical protein